MNPAQLQQQATQAAQQGQQQYQSDINQANTSAQQANDFQNQATTANQNVQNYAQYLQGAGSGTNLYNTGLSSAEQQEGFDPRVLATATQNLTQGQNALYGLNQAAQSSSGGYGLSGAQLGNYYASQSQPLANQVQTQGQAVGNLTGLLTAAQNQANQGAGLGVQGEQTTANTLNQVFTNAQAQFTTAQQNMQMYSQLAQQQGGLNAQQAQGYAASLASYQQAQLAIAQAQQSYAQAGLLGSQTTGQNISNQAAQAQLAASQQRKPQTAGIQNPTAARTTVQNTPNEASLGNVLKFITGQPLTAQ